MTSAQIFFIQNDDIIRTLARRFVSYTLNHIDEFTIRSWLAQFDDADKLVALKLLQNVMYFDPVRLNRTLAELHQRFVEVAHPDWNRTYILPFGEAHEGSGRLIPEYHLASGLTNRRYDRNFIYDVRNLQGTNKDEIANFYARDDLVFVFLDDFIGTGGQAMNIWDGRHSASLPPKCQSYLLIPIAFSEGITNLNNTAGSRLIVVPHTTLNDQNKCFSTANSIFSQDEKEVLHKYCQRTGDRWPDGFGNIQALVVFYYRAPNDTISILRADPSSSLRGLFPRFSS